MCHYAYTTSDNAGYTITVLYFYDYVLVLAM